MTTIDFNVELLGSDGKPTFLGPDGKEYPWGTLAQHLANILGDLTKENSTIPPTLKLYGWMKELRAGKRLQLDQSDKTELRKLIDEHKTMKVFFKGQLLEIIDKAKDE